MRWPTPQEYNEAIQNPTTCFNEPGLVSGSVVLNALGLPRADSGNFASVYRVTGANQDCAVRCFLTNRNSQDERYRIISQYVRFDDLECTVDFEFVEKGIKVGSNWFPVLKMPWIIGETLERYVARNVANPEAMFSLAKQFFDMIRELEVNDVAHGDLQHGNILVTQSGLRLVDYDSLFVPGLKGFASLELGHPNYQHPERDPSHFDPTVDNFSTWLIYVSLMCLAIDGDLFNRFECGDDCLIFKRKDLVAPEESNVFRALLEHESGEIRSLVTLINRLLWLSPNAIPPLDIPQKDWSFLPTSPSVVLQTEDSNECSSVVFDQNVSIRDTLVHVSNQEFQEELQATPPPGRRKTHVLLITEFAARSQKRLDKVLDSCLRKLDVTIWFKVKLSEADKYYLRGDYSQASERYKAIESQSARLNQNRNMDVLLRLGCCFIQMNLPKVASNFFMLAAQAKSDDDLIAQTKRKFFQCLCSKNERTKASVIKLLTELIDHRTDMLNSCRKPVSVLESRHGAVQYWTVDNPELYANLIGIRDTISFLQWAKTACWQIPIKQSDWSAQILAIQSLSMACAQLSNSGLSGKVGKELLVYARSLFENNPEDAALALSFGLYESQLLSTGEFSPILLKVLPGLADKDIKVALKELATRGDWQVIANKLTPTLNKLAPSPHTFRLMQLIWSINKEQGIVVEKSRSRRLKGGFIKKSEQHIQDEIAWLRRFDGCLIEAYVRDDLRIRLVAYAESTYSDDPHALVRVANSCGTLGKPGRDIRLEILEYAIELLENDVNVVFPLAIEIEDSHLEDLFQGRIREKLLCVARTQFQPGDRSLSAFLMKWSKLENHDIIATIFDAFFDEMLAHQDAYAMADLEFARELAETYNVPIARWDEFNDWLLIRQLERTS
ncbi:MAG: hypothetical protein SGJ27_13555 [Candidatus Melainabacteria bacterium]|nr:hypothetical protein [Candidatus Melainabacteria bacterium]